MRFFRYVSQFSSFPCAFQLCFKVLQVPDPRFRILFLELRKVTKVWRFLEVYDTYATISKVKLPPLNCFIHLKGGSLFIQNSCYSTATGLYMLSTSGPTSDSIVLKVFAIITRGNVSFYPPKTRCGGFCRFWVLINEKKYGVNPKL